MRTTCNSLEHMTLVLTTTNISKTECVENESNKMMCYILIYMAYNYEMEVKLDKQNAQTQIQTLACKN